MSNSPKNIKINDSHETRIALLEQSIGHIGQTLLRIESRIDNLDKSLNIRIDRLDARIDKLDARIDKVENKLWQILFLISSSIIGMILGKIFHLL
jgi:hypothetical protein